MFLNQMFPGACLPAAVADFLASMMNPTLATWEMSPAATLIERSAAQWMARMIGMKSGSSGIFLPGGSLSNLMALTVARNIRLGPDVRSKGLSRLDVRGAIICSAACHYSVANAANLLGIGADQVITVEVNERNEMLASDLVEKLAWCDRSGLYPFAVVATMGITVTGGFDPLADIVDICRDRDIHIHVDAAFGGGISLAEEGRHIFAGIEAAHTVIWDTHKWLHTPLASTVLLTPDEGILKHVFSSNAHYLYHPQHEEIDVADDLGQYTILCGKRFDALRIWLLFKAYGERYFRDIAEGRMNLMRSAAAMIEQDDEFQLSYQPKSPLICFRYLPESLGDCDPEYLDRLHRDVREQAKRRGIAFFNMARLQNRIHFRMVLVNPLTEPNHIRILLEEARALSRAHLAEHPLPAPSHG
jgi:glutamate/tyrosine decarboxylase-like PLP-dependent enzyme